MLAQGMQEDPEQYSLALIGRIVGEFGDLDEDTFQHIQAHALSVCRRLENGVPMPIFVRPNTWAAKDLEYDVMTLDAAHHPRARFQPLHFFRRKRPEKSVSLSQPGFDSAEFPSLRPLPSPHGGQLYPRRWQRGPGEIAKDLSGRT